MKPSIYFPNKKFEYISNFVENTFPNETAEINCRIYETRTSETWIVKITLSNAGINFKFSFMSNSELFSLTKYARNKKTCINNLLTQVKFRLISIIISPTV